ncbi:GtrA family protein [Amycolatopsis acidiphila]|uniref:GtrA family protein n=1 Tax=Amycolatopsis acidiphila TaxID=715473 RepID=A0A558AH85_9PSEU|nr:GtrA family protein [Amycolatopsis acidiphila]TVT23620.1 GtrA family protein [Amycolatopsis acidiphila]UIJ58606.1 GtrA family protein [Amycolatopsis acidiphila]GHG76522.1 sugar translocase [Amycolatopsis acidiphila]
MTTAQWSGQRVEHRLDATHPLVWYLVAGAVTTGLQELIFLAARPVIESVAANVVAIAVTTLANTEFHRRVTFAHMRPSPLKLHLQSLGTFAFYAGYGSVVLVLLQAIVHAPSATLEAVVLAVTSTIGGALRFVVLRWWVFTTR